MGFSLKTIAGPRLYRITGIVSVLLWTAALFSTGGGLKDGLFFVTFGWLLPLEGIAVFTEYPYGIFGCFAWYANILLIPLLLLLFLGKKPNHIISIMAFFLALTGVFPLPMTDFERGGVKWDFLGGMLNFWLWLSSFAIIWATALYAKKNTVKQF